MYDSYLDQLVWTTWLLTKDLNCVYTDSTGKYILEFLFIIFDS